MCSRKILKTVFCLSKTVITLLFFFVTQSYRLQVIFSSTIKNVFVDKILSSSVTASQGRNVIINDCF